MNTPLQQIAKAFSEGDFSATYVSMSDKIQWQIIGASTIDGKNNVINHCNKMKAEMGNSALINTNCIVGENMVAVQGYCAYHIDSGAPGRVDYCDVYKFSADELSAITSYVIEVKA